MSAVLIVGGTSGLGLEIAEILEANNQVFVAGRRHVEIDGIRSLDGIDLSHDADLPTNLDKLVDRLPNLALVVYASGFYQEGRLSELSDEDIIKMDNLGLRAPAMLMARILRKQEKLPGFIAITSTSQWKPREKEPMYTATKAGLGMLANSLAEDPNIEKVLHVAPGGMQTAFWEGTDKDTSTMLDPKWVAQVTIESFLDDFRYRYIRLNRDPQEVVEVERR